MLRLSWTLAVSQYGGPAALSVYHLHLYPTPDSTVKDFSQTSIEGGTKRELFQFRAGDRTFLAVEVGPFVQHIWRNPILHGQGHFFLCYGLVDISHFIAQCVCASAWHQELVVSHGDVLPVRAAIAPSSY